MSLGFVIECPSQVGTRNRVIYLAQRSKTRQPRLVTVAVQFALLTDSTAHSSKITLKLRQIPLGVAIKHIVDLANMQSTVGAYGIEIRPIHSESNNIHLATYVLTPENMERITSSIINRIGESSQPSPQVIFKNMGVEFPQGAAIFWNSNSGHLIVRNILSNLNLLETFLEGLEPPAAP